MARTRLKSTELELAGDINKDRLFGKDKNHLKQIEEALEVKITPHSKGLKFANVDYKQCEIARKVVESMISNMRDGKHLTHALIGTLINEQRENVLNKDSRPALKSTFNGTALQLKSKIIEPRTPGQKTYVQGIIDNVISFGIGEAGTGKTFLAVAAAIDAYERGECKKIILCRPAVEAGEKLGFLPGDQKDKVDPYFRPIYDALGELLPKYKTLLDSGTIEIAPLAFMRGRTLKNAFVVLDEAQNTTSEQMKMFLTRLGEGSKMVINGDISQIDLPADVKSGLKEALEAQADVEGVFIHHFTIDDVVRHDMVGRMLEGYKRLKERESATPATPSPQ